MNINDKYFDDSYKKYLLNKFIENDRRYDEKKNIFKEKFLIPYKNVSFKNSGTLKSFEEFNDFNKNFKDIFKNPKKKNFIDFAKYNYELYEVDYYGTKFFGLYISSIKKEKNNTKLSIVSSPQIKFDQVFSLNLELFNFLLQNRSDIFVIYPFNMGLNTNHDIYMPISFDKEKSFIHRFTYYDDKSYTNYFDVDHMQIKPFAMIISGQYYMLKNFFKKNYYKSIDIFGLSQGAQNTLILSSFIDSFDNVYIINGVIPKEFNFEKLNNVHKKYEYNSFFSIFDNFDLIFLSLRSINKLNLIFNINDKHNSSNAIYFKRFIEELKNVDFLDRFNLKMNNLEVHTFEGSLDHEWNTNILMKLSQ